MSDTPRTDHFFDIRPTDPPGIVATKTYEACVEFSRALERDLVNARILLDAAKCPNCDGGGTTPHGDQCEWCFRARLALKTETPSEYSSGKP